MGEGLGDHCHTTGSHRGHRSPGRRRVWSPQRSLDAVMRRTIRKFALVSHIAVSVGWLGSVSVFLVLAITGLTSKDAPLVRASYLSSDLITRFVILPLCIAAL